VQTTTPQQVVFSTTDKRILPAFLLCFFVGCFGAHRFYVGKTGTAIAQLFTLGGLGIWMLIDLIMILCGAFTDAAGNKITVWT
jgi:TM2 domain-containing membrane protein YozV